MLVTFFVAVKYMGSEKSTSRLDLEPSGEAKLIVDYQDSIQVSKTNTGTTV